MSSTRKNDGFDIGIGKNPKHIGEISSGLPSMRTEALAALLKDYQASRQMLVKTKDEARVMKQIFTDIGMDYEQIEKEVNKNKAFSISRAIKSFIGSKIGTAESVGVSNSSIRRTKETLEEMSGVLERLHALKKREDDIFSNMDLSNKSFPTEGLYKNQIKVLNNNRKALVEAMKLHVETMETYDKINNKQNGKIILEPMANISAIEKKKELANQRKAAIKEENRESIKLDQKRIVDKIFSKDSISVGKKRDTISNLEKAVNEKYAMMVDGKNKTSGMKLNDFTVNKETDRMSQLQESLLGKMQTKFGGDFDKNTSIKTLYKGKDKQNDYIKTMIAKDEEMSKMYEEFESLRLGTRRYNKTDAAGAKRTISPMEMELYRDKSIEINQVRGLNKQGADGKLPGRESVDMAVAAFVESMHKAAESVSRTNPLFMSSRALDEAGSGSKLTDIKAVDERITMLNAQSSKIKNNMKNEILDDIKKALKEPNSKLLNDRTNTWKEMEKTGMASKFDGFDDFNNKKNEQLAYTVERSVVARNKEWNRLKEGEKIGKYGGSFDKYYQSKNEESAYRSASKVTESYVQEQKLNEGYQKKLQGQAEKNDPGKRLTGMLTTLSKMGIVAYTAYRTVKGLLGGYYELEQAIFSLGVVSGETLTGIKELRGEIMSMASDSLYSATEIAKALDDIVKTGKTLEDAKEIVRETSKLAGASFESLEFATTSVNKAMIAFDINANRASEIVQQYYNAAQSTPLSLQSLDESLRNSASSFASVMDFTNRSGDALEDYKVSVNGTVAALTGVQSLMGYYDIFMFSSSKISLIAGSTL